jgi:hypothetical protein
MQMMKRHHETFDVTSQPTIAKISFNKKKLLCFVIGSKALAIKVCTLQT